MREWLKYVLVGAIPLFALMGIVFSLPPVYIDIWWVTLILDFLAHAITWLGVGFLCLGLMLMVFPNAEVSNAKKAEALIIIWGTQILIDLIII
jgi:hypothetical protein